MEKENRIIWKKYIKEERQRLNELVRWAWKFDPRIIEEEKWEQEEVIRLKQERFERKEKLRKEKEAKIWEEQEKWEKEEWEL